MRRFWVWATVLMVIVAASASAGVITSPTAVIGTTFTTGGGTLDNTINQTGLSAGFVSGVTDFATYIAGNPTHAPNDFPNAWASAPPQTSGDIDYDLGDTFILNTFALWGDVDEQTIDSFTLFGATNPAFTGAVNLGTFNATLLNPITVQTFPSPATARYVRLRINTSHGGPNINMGEVAFETGVIPEPATLTLLAVGGLALLRRRRKH